MTSQKRNRIGYRSLMIGIVCLIAFTFLEYYKLKLPIAKYIFLTLGIIMTVKAMLEITFKYLCILFDFDGDEK